MPRRKRISDEAVLAAAMRVMARTSPADYTLAAVAAEAGVSPATLVQRFGDKHALIVRAVAHDNEAFARMLEALPPGRGPAETMAVFLLLTPAAPDPDAFADQLAWLRLDMRDPELRRLAQARFDLLRQAVAERAPPLPLTPLEAARVLEAQWQGALIQWGVAREGRLADYVVAALATWFSLVGGGQVA